MGAVYSVLHFNHLTNSTFYTHWIQRIAHYTRLKHTGAIKRVNPLTVLDMLSTVADFNVNTYHIQHICSRWLEHPDKNMEPIYKKMYNINKGENIVTKGNPFHYEQVFFITMFSKYFCCRLIKTRLMWERFKNELRVFSRVSFRWQNVIDLKKYD